MSYTTEALTQVQGNPSLLVASCEILERFGDDVSPVTLDTYIREFGGEDYVSAYNGNIAQSNINTGGLPPHNNAIVMFQNSLYAAVYRIEGNAVAIIDSSDGEAKRIDEYEPLYGPIIAWWTYSSKQVEPEPEPKVAMVYKENEVDGIEYRNFGTPKKMYVRKQEGADLIDFGIPISNYRDFVGIPNTHKKFGEEVRIMGVAHHPILPLGQDFYVNIDDWGQFTGTGHVARTQGYFKGDLSEVLPERPPKPLPQEKPVDTDTNVIISEAYHIPVKTPVTALPSWKATYKPYPEPKRFEVWRSFEIQDFAGKYPNVPVGPQAALNTLTIYGTFWVDGIVYGRAKPPGDTLFESAYGVPFDDPDTNEPNIGEQEIYTTEVTAEERSAIEIMNRNPEVRQAVTKVMRARDYLQAGASTVEKHTEMIFNKVKRRK